MKAEQKKISKSAAAKSTGTRRRRRKSSKAKSSGKASGSKAKSSSKAKTSRRRKKIAKSTVLTTPVKKAMARAAKKISAAEKIVSAGGPGAKAAKAKLAKLKLTTPTSSDMKAEKKDLAKSNKPKLVSVVKKLAATKKMGLPKNMNWRIGVCSNVVVCMLRVCVVM